MSLTRFPHGVSSFGMPVLGSGPVLTTGNIFFVDSGAAAGADSTDRGASPDKPFLTLDYAIGRCTASNGDVIFVMPGHAEAPTATITADIAGISIIGLGNGNNRPVFTPAHTANDDTLDVTAADVKVANIVIAAGTNSTGNTVQLNVGGSAHNFVMENCKIEMGAKNLQAITVAATAHRGRISSLQVTGTAANPDTIIVWEGGSDDWIVEDVDAVFTAATDIDGPVFYQNAVKMENLIIRNVRIIALKADGLALDFNSASTGFVSDLYIQTLSTTFGAQFDLGSLSCHNVLVAGVAKKAMPYPAATLAIS